MKSCPNCGALIGDGQTTCSICNSPISNDNNSNNGNQNKFFFFDGDNQKVEGNIYEPLPTNNNEENKKESVEETTKNSDEEKKDVMTNILKEHEEKTNKKEEKNDSFKAALLSILVVIIIVVGGYYAVKLGFDNINDGQDHIINSVVNQANAYTTIIKNYMKKFDYKYNTISLNGYYAKSRTFNFVSTPLTSKCVFAEGKWSGADSDDTSCSEFFNDINNNYCTAVPCDIPSSAEIYLKETYENVDINGNEETITSGTILDGSTLTYDDVTCSLSNNTYTCQYIEKQDK